MFRDALVKILESSYHVRFVFRSRQRTRLLLRVRSFVFVGMALHGDVAINLEKPTAPVMKFPIFYEARSVIACFKKSLTLNR